MSKAPDRDEMREAIMDAAERLMTRYGFQKMTMTDLADEADIGVGTTYLHFAGKADVMLAVVERNFRRIQAQLRAIADSDASPSHRLREILIARVLIRFELARPQHHRREEYRQVIEAALRECRATRMAEEAHLIAEVLTEGQAHGDFAASDAEQDAQALIDATNALMPRNLHPQEFEEPNRIRTRIERLASLLLRAVTKKCEWPLTGEARDKVNCVCDV